MGATDGETEMGAGVDKRNQGKPGRRWADSFRNIIGANWSESNGEDTTKQMQSQKLNNNQ